MKIKLKTIKKILEKAKKEECIQLGDSVWIVTMESLIEDLEEYLKEYEEEDLQKALS